MINLVMHAFDAMPDGGHLDIGVAPADGMVKLTVAETGLGISREIVGNIFDPFFTDNKCGKGHGSVLPVWRVTFEGQPSNITVESEQGKGTTFTIHLPVYQPNS